MEVMHRSLLNYYLQQQPPCSCTCTIISKGAVRIPSVSKSATRNYSSSLGLQFPGKRQTTTPLSSSRYALNLGLQKYMPRGCSERKIARRGWLYLSRRLMSSEADVAPIANVDQLKEQLEALEEEAQQAMARGVFLSLYVRLQPICIAFICQFHQSLELQKISR
ncbi:hypothetical protein O6H91_Y445900 [Diphasiastrum complanatum]|nr:hypothetical protein O6H91_Y445900 [Diphasiastrum complanatum]